MGPITVQGVKWTQGRPTTEAMHMVTSLLPATQPFLKLQKPAPHASIPGSIILPEYQHPIKAESWASALNYRFSQRSNPKLTNSPHETGKENMYVIATLRISYKKSKGMSNAARKTLHLHSLHFQGKCQQQGKHRDLITSRDIRKELKCIWNAEAESFFFFLNIFSYSMKASPSTRI